jgi:carbon storage regulator CsrA
MLVLTRKRDETIKIGSNIVIRVMKTRNGSVKLGIEAPAHIKVLRGEVATADEVDAGDIFAQIGDELLDECMLEALMVQS